MPKKSNTKRADGRICVQVYLGIVDGKRKYKTVYGQTQKEAEQKADEVKRRLGKGLDVTTKHSVSDWINYYLSAKEIETSTNQLKLIESRLKIWEHHIGRRSISEIKPIDIQTVIQEITKCNPYTGKPSSTKTVKDYLRTLHQVFDYAIDNLIIEFNPVDRVKVPKGKESYKRRALSKEERTRILEFEHRGQMAMVLLMLSGLRRGEATALLWEDIDLNNKTITVNKSYDFKSSSIKCPKNGKSRVIVIPDKLVEFLKKREDSDGLVIKSASGKPMTETAWKRLLESYLNDMNYHYGGFCDKQSKYSPKRSEMIIEPFTLHCLRHTFCTMLYESGIDVLVAKEQLGHSDVKTTLSIYTHLDQQHKLNDISKLNRLLDS